MPKQKFLSSGTCSSASTVYINVCAFSGTSISLEPVPPLGLAGNFRKMYVKLVSDPDSGSSAKGYVFTLRKNKVDTVVTTTILSSTASFQNSYTGADVHFTATDTVSLSVVRSSTPANSPAFSVILEFEADAGDGSTTLLSGFHGNLSSTTGQYAPIAGEESGNVTEGIQYVVIPMSGTITSFSANVVVAPGGTATRVYTLRQNASSVGTTISYSSGTSGIITQSQSLTVSQGDRFTILSTVANSPAASAGGFSIIFKPTTSGQFIIPMNVVTALSNSASSYTGIAGINTTASSTETIQNIATADFSLQGWTAYLLNTPGGGAKKWTVSLRENGGAAPTTYSTDMTTIGPTTSASTNYVIPTNYNLYDTIIVPTSTPTGSRIAISYIGFSGVNNVVVTLVDLFFTKDFILPGPFSIFHIQVGKKLNDSITIGDLLLKDSKKYLYDIVVITDVILKRVTGKKLQDSIVVTDNSLLRRINKKLKDSVVIGDVLLRKIGKKLSDSVSFLDVLNKETIRTFIEDVVISDILNKLIKKKLQDSIVIQDLLYKGYGKRLNDVIVVSDLLNRRIGKKLLDSVAINDRLSKRSIKFLKEQISLFDLLSVITLEVIQLIEQIVFTDSLTKVTKKKLQEDISLSDFLKRRTGKKLQDDIILSDLLTKQTVKILREQFTLIDLLFVLLPVFILQLFEQIVITDILHKGTKKIFNESITLIDTVIRQLNPIVTKCKQFGRWLGGW